MIENSALNDFDLPINKSAMLRQRLNAFKKSFDAPKQLTQFHNKNIFNTERIIEHCDLDFKEVICTTYFTTKNDPQRNEKAKLDAIEYIAPWYNSMKALKLFGIVFYDNLSKDFIDKYQTKTIIFLKCTLGNYSLNDERFFIYYMFFLKHKVKHILLTDGNDVMINKSPFTFFESKKESTIFVGRGQYNKLIHSKWNLSSINKLSDGLNETMPNNFFEMASYNAGIIGGNYYTVMYFLRQICFVLLQIDDNSNNNMPAMHYVLYYYFYPKCRDGVYGWLYNLTNKYQKKRIIKRIKKFKMNFLFQENINYKHDKTAISAHIYSGYPLNSKFYFFESNSEAFLTHK